MKYDTKIKKYRKIGTFQMALSEINSKNYRMILEFKLAYLAGRLLTSDIDIIARDGQKDKRKNEDYYSEIIIATKRK